MTKYENFQLDWNINNVNDFYEALVIFDSWAESGTATCKDVKSFIEIADIVDVPVKLEIIICFHCILLSPT